jgi:hypothetical protein
MQINCSPSLSPHTLKAKQVPPSVTEGPDRYKRRIEAACSDRVARSEDQLGGHLQLTRWEETGDTAKASIAAVGVWIGVVHMVQQIEGLAANIEERRFIPETKALVQAEIQLIEGIITQRVAAGVSIRLAGVGWDAHGIRIQEI